MAETRTGLKGRSCLWIGFAEPLECTADCGASTRTREYSLECVSLSPSFPPSCSRLVSSSVVSQFLRCSCLSLAPRRCSRRCSSPPLLADAGNGSFVHIVDFGDVGTLGLHEAMKGYPYVKASILAISLEYGGTCRRIFVARPPRIFHLCFSMLRPFLPDKTNAKIGVLPARTVQRLDDFGSDAMCAMSPDSVPPLLGGTRQEWTEPVHCTVGAAVAYPGFPEASRAQAHAQSQTHRDRAPGKVR